MAIKFSGTPDLWTKLTDSREGLHWTQLTLPNSPPQKNSWLISFCYIKLPSMTSSPKLETTQFNCFHSLLCLIRTVIIKAISLGSATVSHLSRDKSHKTMAGIRNSAGKSCLDIKAFNWWYFLKGLSSKNSPQLQMNLLKWRCLLLMVFLSACVDTEEYRTL